MPCYGHIRSLHTYAAGRIGGWTTACVHWTMDLYAVWSASRSILTAYIGSSLIDGWTELHISDRSLFMGGERELDQSQMWVGIENIWRLDNCIWVMSKIMKQKCDKMVMKREKWTPTFMLQKKYPIKYKTHQNRTNCLDMSNLGVLHYFWHDPYVSTELLTHILEFTYTLCRCERKVGVIKSTKQHGGLCNWAEFHHIFVDFLHIGKVFFME